MEETAATIGVDLTALDTAPVSQSLEVKENLGILSNKLQIRAVEVFNAIDKDKNQILTKGELEGVFPNNETSSNESEKQAWKILDDLNVKDPGNNHIEIREWLHFVRIFKHQFGKAALETLMTTMTKTAEKMVVHKQVHGRDSGPKTFIPHTTTHSRFIDPDPNQLNRQERNAAVLLFRALDKDMNELLTVQEIKLLCNTSKAYEHGADEDAQEMFDAIEENNDGHISMTEWLHFIRNIKRGVVADVDFKGSEGVQKWMTMIEAKVVLKPEDRKVPGLLQGDDPYPTKPVPVPRKIYEIPGSKLFTPKDRLRLEKWHVRRQMLIEQMAAWRHVNSRDAAIFTGEQKIASLNPTERSVAMAIMNHLDMDGTQHVARADVLDMFEADTVEAIDLFGKMNRLLTPTHKPSGLVLQDWLEFLRKLKGERGSKAIGNWFTAVGKRIAKRTDDDTISRVSGDLGLEAALKGEPKQMKESLKRIFKARAAAAADLERVTQEKQEANIKAWEIKEAKRKAAAKTASLPMFTQKPMAATPILQSPPGLMKSLSPSKSKSPSPGGKKKKKRSPSKQGFLSPSPLLPGRMQLSPIAATILDPKRDKPFTDNEVDEIAQQIIRQRHALSQSVDTSLLKK